MESQRYFLLPSLVNRVYKWCTDNYLPINTSKCKIGTFTLKKQPLIFDYVIGTSHLTHHDVIRDLGVMYDSRLSFSNHINSTMKSAFGTLGFIIRNTKSFTDVSALKSLYFSLVRSKLEYCSLVWFPCYQIYSNHLERIQRRFLKFMSLRVDNYYPYRGYDHQLLLQRFNMQSLNTRRVLTSLAFLFKLFNGLVDSQALLSLFNIRVPRPGSRENSLFYCQNARTNILLKSPIYSMANNYNQIADQCDIFHCNIDDLLKIALDYFNNFEY